MTSIPSFVEIANLSTSDISYEFTDRNNLKFKSKKFPWSIKEPEFLEIYKIIKENNLKSGFEISTGIGISGLAAGLAFKETGGKLVTIDAYIEEFKEDWYYEGHPPFRHHDSLGWKNINFLIDTFSLKGHIIPCCGWSPTDNKSLIELYLPKGLDYVFIDGCHFPDQIINDIDSVIPFLKENAILVFHDYYDVCFTDKVKSYIMSKFGKLPYIVVDNIEGDNLAILKINEG